MGQIMSIRIQHERVQHERRLLPHGRKREAGYPEGRVLPVRLHHQRELLSAEPLIHRENQTEGKDVA